MIDYKKLRLALDTLSAAMDELKRVTSLMKMSDQDHPCRPLVRVMCKLGLIKNWPI